MTTKKMTASIEKLTLFLLSACALSRVNSAPPREVKIGMLLSWSSKSVPAYRYAGAVTRAIDDINNSTQILPGINVTYVQGDIACNAHRTGVTVDLFNRGVDVFIGPPCYKDCLWGGLLSSYEKIPMISFGCSSERLSNKKEYTYFARTKPFARTSTTYTPKAFAQVMHRFNWKRACIVVSDSDVYTPIALATLDEFERQNFTSFYEKYFEEYSTFEDKKYILQKLNKTCRIFVFLMERKSIMDFAVQAYHLGWMQTNKYAFIHMDFEFDKMTEADMEKWKVDKETMYHKVLEGIISISNTRPNTSDLEYNRFREDVVRRLKDDFGSTTITEQNRSVSSSAAYLYDATMLYARGLTSVLLENANASLRDAKLIYEHMKMQSFEGITGHVKVDEFGDRIPQYEIINVHNGTYNKILAYDPLKNNSAHMMMDLDSTVYFVGGFTTPPIDDPCGRNNEFCKVGVPKDIDLVPPLIGAAVGVLVLVLIVSAYLYNKRKYEMEILRKGVIINMKEVALSAKSNNNNSGNVSFKASIRSNKSGTSHFSTFSKTRLGPYFNKGGGGSRVVVYRANLYFMKVVNMCKVEFNKETLMTLKHMKDLNSANINTFVGIATQGPDCHLFWNHCSKGSLQDILQNDEIDCDWLFRISFAKDIVKGLHEIQRSPLGYHGNLNSSNCLIDNRWVCKLSNFGTKRFPDGLKKHAANTYEEYKTSFWHAPEKLARSLDHSEAQADVYSYGVILYEICTRGDPYALELEQGLEPRDIIENVKTQHDFRPVIPTGMEAPAHYAELMQRCWKHEPQQRPSLRDITKAIMKMEKSNGIKGGLVDHMLLMMEKYANNLEDLVAERTDQLQNEKQKTEALLYKMLPVSVANRLKEGQPVGAESFDSVTIFFSDIVGFTKICSDSTPLQVVEMLNDLYICFDNCIDMYDVYKVETIGDAYMVVSGIPIRNGLRHAGEIATMSLDLLSCVKTFEIKHKPQTQMQLRVGMHTGSCVAGVVGLKMPRYCLFGDTVNYASRMESSGLALRVHVSPECKQALDQLGGYHLQERGAVEMKGKGTITTFFLTGKQGFDKELPDTGLAASLEDHTFK